MLVTIAKRPNRETKVKVQICENNWVRRIMRVKKPDKIRMDELRVELGIKETFTKIKLERCILK